MKKKTVSIRVLEDTAHLAKSKASKKKMTRQEYLKDLVQKDK